MTKNSIVITGTVIRGLHYGTALGFPTANLDRRQFSRMRIKIKLGVFQGWAELPSARKYTAAIVIGPIDKTGLPKIEAHLLGFKGNLYGKKILLQIGKFIREFKKFPGEAELKIQIKEDIKIIKNISK
ncbi:MAG: riboflavin kinase [Candidatus Doudnabacteria bacterium]|nr:riboflavin kinase [Candidatus Doudnabacteria bacterium]